jgi:hypothetical protein
MQDSPVERWKTLCQEAATEQDPQKLLDLIMEINRLLEEKLSRASGKKVESNSPDGKDSSISPRP